MQGLFLFVLKSKSYWPKDQHLLKPNLPDLIIGKITEVKSLFYKPILFDLKKVLAKTPASDYLIQPETVATALFSGFLPLIKSYWPKDQPQECGRLFSLIGV